MANQCDFGHETKDEVRRLPTGGDGAILVCFKHYQQEMNYRGEMVRVGTWSANNTDFPLWVNLKVYSEEAKP